MPRFSSVLKRLSDTLGGAFFLLEHFTYSRGTTKDAMGGIDGQAGFHVICLKHEHP